MSWEDPQEVMTPEGCNPCRWCGGYCMFTEEIQKDWHGRGVVIRIDSACDASDQASEFDCGPVKLIEKGQEKMVPLIGHDSDLNRTEFAPEAEAVAEWNKMNPAA